MKHLRLVGLILAVFVGGAVLARAESRARSSHASCPGASASAASAGCPMGSAQCAKGAKGASAAAASASCPMGSAQCTAEMRAACAKGALEHKGTQASAAAMGGDCCAKGAKGASAAAEHCEKGAAAAGAEHCAKGAAEASACGACGYSLGVVANAGGKCEMGGMATHTDCAVCSDGLSCVDDLHGVNAHTQVVALRNGAMIVYTADNAEGVRTLQSTLARHNERVMSALATGSAASLCNGCRVFRGAMASGKFSRELVNVKSGAQILVTSNDREIVRRIHDLTSAPTAARTNTKM